MISLAICTYNRCGSLQETLHSLAAQGTLQGLAEVLVVDNNSTDSTQHVAKSFTSDLPIRRVVEVTQGLSHARNRAIKEFKGDILLFTDDDVRLDNNWLSAYARAIHQFPEAQFFGGRILPKWNGEPPRWFKNERLSLLDGVLVWYDYGPETHPFAPEEQPPFGASFGVRRCLLEAIGGFRTDLGRVGVAFGRGEETEFLQRAIGVGVRGVYVGKALCWHKVDPSRLSVSALYRYGIESGRAHALITGMVQSRSLRRVPLHLARGLVQLLKGRGDRFRQCIINAGIEIGMRRATLQMAHKS